MGESSLLCPDFIYKTLDKVHIIKNLLQIDYIRQKSYDDQRIRELEFEEGVIRFCMKGKLSPRYVGLYEILQKIGKVIYDMKFPSELASVHLVFLFFYA